MELRRGITGFRGRNDPTLELPFSNLKEFRSHCHFAARAIGAKIQSIQDPVEARRVCSYALARLEFSESIIAVILNLFYPIIAYAKCPKEGQTILEFIDCQKLTEIFSTFDKYWIATSEELNHPLGREMCANLSAAELKRVRYFRPKRVGDVIFNYWD